MRRDPPDHLVVFGNFRGGASRPDGPWRPIEVDRDNIDDVIARIAPEIPMPDGAVLRIREMEHFHPDSLWERIPMFEAIRQARRAAADPAAYAEPEKPVAPPLKPGLSFLDQMVAATPAAKPTPGIGDEESFKDLVRGIVSPHVQPKASSRQREVLAAIDEAAAAQMRLVLHAPEFQSLEAAWRAIELMVSRIESGAELKLFLVDATPKELASGDPTELLDEAAAAAGLYEFTHSEADCGALARIGAAAQAARVPFLTGYRYDEDDAPGPAWQRLRRSGAAGWLGVIAPRMLMRLPYGRDARSTDALEFEEMTNPPAHEDFLWGSPAAAALCVLSGVESAEILGLPIYNWRDGHGQPQMQVCGEFLVTDRAAEAVLDRGVMPFIPAKGRDAARLPWMLSLADPPAVLSF